MEITKSIFREYDIRGVYPHQIDEEVVGNIAKAISIKCKKEGVNKICVGRDGRLSGESLLETLSFSLSQYGLDVENIGMVTTPLLYFAAKKNKSKSGIMITGSHNPKEYNGIKLVINDKPVSGNEIYKLINTDIETSKKIGQIKYKDIKDEYVSEVVENINLVSDKKIKVVIDCGNGSAGCIAPILFKKLGCEVIELYSDVDGNFPNHHPDPGKLENLKDLVTTVKSSNADLGLAFDGDGDRVGLICDKGEVIFPDKILMMMSKDILQSKKGKIIFDVKCTNRLKDVILSYGGEPIMSPTGHFHIKKMLRKTDAHLAGEMSGHIFFNDDWYGFDDAHYSGFRLIKILIENESELSELLGEFPDGFTTPEINLDVDEDKKFQIVDEFKKSASFENASVSMLDGLRVEYEDGWGLLRASNTTPKLVLRFEGTSQKSLDDIIRKFNDEFQKVHPNLDKIIDQI